MSFTNVISRFKKPTSKDEYWRYSAVERYLGLSHEMLESEEPVIDLKLSAEVTALLAQYPNRIVFYNGVLSDALTSSAQLGEMHQALGQSVEHDYFDSENMQLARSKCGLEVKASQTLLLLYLYGRTGEIHPLPRKRSTRFALSVASGVTLNLCEYHLALSEIEFSHNHSVDITVDKAAKLNRLKAFWTGNLASVFDRENLRVEAGAEVRNCLLNFGGAWTRCESSAELVGAEALYDYSGLYLQNRNSIFDLTSNIQHRVGQTKSAQLFKGILRDKSRAAFNGRIVIHKDAQKSETSQLNQNVLLNEGAEADTRPQLEVYADDVKAKHGASIGQLNEQEIFYLQSRAISRDNARLLVAQGYANHIAEQIFDPQLQASAKDLVARGFVGIIGQGGL